MIRKQILIITATVTVFAWSTVMVVMGHAAAIASLAPALGLTIQQIVGAARPHPDRALGQGGQAAGDREGRVS